MTIAPILSLIVTTVVLWMIKGKPLTWGLMFLLIPAAFVTVVLGAPGIWLSAMAGYTGDSFWTLGIGGRLGVIVISITGFALIFALLSLRPTTPKGLPPVVRVLSRCVLGCVIYGFLYSVSPQLFYTFYRFIFPDLPVQIVVSDAFDLARIAKSISLQTGGSLSDHLAGLGFWAILPFTIWVCGRRGG